MKDTRRDADSVRAYLREYFVERMGDEESGELIGDKSGFLKTGEESVGVGRILGHADLVPNLSPR